MVLDLLLGPSKTPPVVVNEPPEISEQTEQRGSAIGKATAGRTNASHVIDERRKYEAEQDRILEKECERRKAAKVRITTVGCLNLLLNMPI